MKWKYNIFWIKADNRENAGNPISDYLSFKKSDASPPNRGTAFGTPSLNPLL